MCLLVFAACISDEIRPKSITESDFDIAEAEAILRDTFEPINMITNHELETKPETKVKSYEEFKDTFNFSLIDERVIRNYIFETIVDSDNEGNPVKDENGFLVYGEGNMICYIPTIFDEGVVIKKAFIRDKDYGTEYSHMDLHELVIVETCNETINKMASGFDRTNRFRMNGNGEWILQDVEGTVSFAWER
jgi:hypothetical protein